MWLILAEKQMEDINFFSRPLRPLRDKCTVLTLSPPSSWSDVNIHGDIQRPMPKKSKSSISPVSMNEHRDHSCTSCHLQLPTRNTLVVPSYIQETNFCGLKLYKLGACLLQQLVLLKLIHLFFEFYLSSAFSIFLFVFKIKFQKCNKDGVSVLTIWLVYTKYSLSFKTIFLS